MADPLTPSHLSIRLVRLPTRRSLAAAHGVPTDEFRMLTLVGLHNDGDLSTTRGWGECSALNAAGYTAEWAEGSFELLRNGHLFADEQSLRAHPMAAAAIEMALLDADLKRCGQSLSDRLGTAGRRARAGAVVGLAPIPTMLEEIEGLAAEGYRRVKCKVAPGKLTEPITAVLTAFPELEVHVDANGSLGRGDIAALIELAQLGLCAVEQPFTGADAARELVSRSDLVVIADETIATLKDLDAAAAAATANAVAVKPPKLGGVGPALALLERAEGLGFGAAIGGMLESGLGRHVLAAMAPLPTFTVTGDLSPASRWLATDPFDDIVLNDGHIMAPARPGIAGDPSPDCLDRHTVRRATVLFGAPEHERLTTTAGRLLTSG